MSGRTDRGPGTTHGANVLGIVSGMQAVMTGEGLRIHRSFGMLIDRLAREFEELVLSVPTMRSDAAEAFDYCLSAPNLTLIPQPHYHGMASSMRVLWGIDRAYSQVCSRAKQLLIRGMIPGSPWLYAHASRNHLRPCHWIVGDPIALLKSHRRGHWSGQALGLGYSYADRLVVRCGRFLTKGAFVCNGAALAAAYHSPKTHIAVSSTLSETDIATREDTCRNERIRILLMSFMRPEKGVEYLVDAMAHLEGPRPIDLILAGPFGRYTSYRALIESRISTLGLQGRVQLADRYINTGADSAALLSSADIFVLPSLSEGTPRILLEARAAGLPVIATEVGGIPSSVRDRYDGLLVPPRDSSKIARAIKELVEDAALRQELIRNGYATARKFTLEAFVQQLILVLPRAEGRLTNRGSAQGEENPDSRWPANGH